MALVPNGKLRYQIKQDNFKNLLFAQNSGLEERDSIEQESLSSIDPNFTDSTTQETQNLNTPIQDNLNTIDPAQNVDMSNQNEVSQDAPVKNNDSGESDIKEEWKKILVGLGVPERSIDNIEKQLYSEETDLSTNTVKGHYMIPTFTSNGKISKKQAKDIALSLDKQFGLTTKMKLEGRNWRFDFTTRQNNEVEQGGSSFDLLSPKKTAQTLGEMLQERKNELYFKMRKIAKGRE